MADRGGKRGRNEPERRETAAELRFRQLDADFRVKIRVIDGTFSFLRTLTRCIAWGGAIYLVGVAIAPFAGKNTVIVALVRSMIAFRADRYVLGVVSVLAGTSWWQERRKRRQQIKEWTPYIKELEEKVTPERTSSGLLLDGRPTKEDADAL